MAEESKAARPACAWVFLRYIHMHKTVLCSNRATGHMENLWHQAFTFNWFSRLYVLHVSCMWYVSYYSNQCSGIAAHFVENWRSLVAWSVTNSNKDVQLSGPRWQMCKLSLEAQVTGASMPAACCQAQDTAQYLSHTSKLSACLQPRNIHPTGGWISTVHGK